MREHCLCHISCLFIALSCLSTYFFIPSKHIYPALNLYISCLLSALETRQAPRPFPFPKWKPPTSSPPAAFPLSSLLSFSFFPSFLHFVSFFTTLELDSLLRLLVAPNLPVPLSPREVRENVLVVRGRRRPAPPLWLLWALRASSTAAWNQSQFRFCSQRRLMLRRSLSRPILPSSIVGWTILRYLFWSLCG